MTALSLAEKLTRALKAEGSDYIFGMPGSHVLSLFDALADEPQIRFVPVIHENNGVFMANMYSYLTGKPGVVLFTAGPGATNSITGVAQAYSLSVPMIHITGDVPSKSDNEPFHGVDDRSFLSKMFQDITKWSVRVEKPDEIDAIVAEAFKVAKSGRPGPVHIDIPIDIASVKNLPSGEYRKSYPIFNAPSTELIDFASVQLINAKRPVICVDRGVLIDRAEEELRQLSQKFQAPVLCTSYSYGAFPSNHPLFLGTFNEFSKNEFAFDLLKDADFLLIVGMRSSTAMTKIISKVATGKSAFAAFDNETTFKPMPEFTVAEPCNAKLFLKALSENAANIHRPEPDSLSRIRNVQEAFQIGLNQTLDSHLKSSPIHFGVVLRRLSQIIPSDSIVMSGVGNHHVWARNVFPALNRESFIAETSWGSMGTELGAGIAAKIVYPNRTVVVVTGDASFLMTCSDFLTAMNIDARIIVVILNDGKHGIIGGMQKLQFKRTFGDDVGKANYASFAQSFGAIGLRIEVPEDIDRVLTTALGESKRLPVIVDVVCGADFPWPNREQLIAAGLSPARPASPDRHASI